MLLRDSSSADTLVPSVAVEGAGPRPVRILLVDDDPDLRSYVAMHLATEGYEISEAQDGVEAFGARVRR